MPTQPYLNKKGKRVPSVTTIISGNLGWNKGVLMHWANKMGLEGKNHRDVSGKAADAGTLAHDMVECEILEKPYKPPEEVDYELLEKAQMCLANFIHWRKSVDFTPVHTELAMVSESFQYGGCIDCLAFINGKLAIFDWKSSNGVYVDYVIQAMAYKHLWEENEPQNPLEGIYLFRMDKKEASWATHFWRDVPKAWEAFKHLRELHDLQKEIKI